MTVSISVGTRFPAHATSMGRVLLAGLERDDLDRVLAATMLDPLTPQTITGATSWPALSIRSVGKVGRSLIKSTRWACARLRRPSWMGDGRAVAAANVSLGANRFGSDPVTYVLPALLDATRRISDMRSANL